MPFVTNLFEAGLLSPSTTFERPQFPDGRHEQSRWAADATAWAATGRER